MLTTAARSPRCRCRRTSRAGAFPCSMTRSTSPATAHAARRRRPLAQVSRRTRRRRFALQVNAGTPLKAVLVWTDPPGTARGVGDTTPELVNDLDLRASDTATRRREPDRLNNVEVVIDRAADRRHVRRSPSPRTRLGFGPRRATRSSSPAISPMRCRCAAVRARAARH